MKRAIICVIIASLFPAIVFAQKKPPVPTVPAPPVYRGVEDPNAPPTPQNLADTRWFDVFRDQQLQTLVREALLHNYDLRDAVARIDLARAQVGLTKSEQYPQIYGSADLTTIGRSRNGQTTFPEPLPKGRTFGSILLNLLSFELDIWGRLRKQTQAARADLLASEEARKAVLTTIVSDVAASYFHPARVRLRTRYCPPYVEFAAGIFAHHQTARRARGVEHARSEASGGIGLRRD